MEEVKMIDDTTCMTKCLVILAYTDPETNELKSEAVQGHVISTLDTETRAATFTINLVNEKGIQMSVPFWPAAEVMKTQIDRLIAKDKTAE